MVKELVIIKTVNSQPLLTLYDGNMNGIVLSCNQIKQKALHISLYIPEMYDLIKLKT